MPFCGPGSVESTVGSGVIIPISEIRKVRHGEIPYLTQSHLIMEPRLVWPQKRKLLISSTLEPNRIKVKDTAIPAGFPGRTQVPALSLR